MDLALIFVSFKYKNSYPLCCQMHFCPSSWSGLATGVGKQQPLHRGAPSPFGRQSGQPQCTTDRQAGVPLSALLACRPASSPAVQFKSADSCSRYEPNDHGHARIFFLQAHSLGTQADDMLMQIGRLEPRWQKYDLPLGRNKGLQGGPFAVGFHVCCHGTP